MNKNKICFLILCASASSWSIACEPVSIEWDDIYRQMYPEVKDVKAITNSAISYQRFQRITHFEPYAWPKGLRYRGENGKRNLFNDLDKNKDQQLSEEELSNIFVYLKNPCAGWPW